MGWSHYAAVMPRFYNNVHWNIENTCYRNTLQITPSNIKHIYILHNIVGWYLLSLKNQSFCTILPHLRETENPNRLVYSFINFFTRVLLPDPLGPDTTRGLKLDILPKKNKAKCESRFEKIKRNSLRHITWRTTCICHRKYLHKPRHREARPQTYSLEKWKLF